jgi:SAM-dependent MidA family methyltransferase
LKDLPLDYTGVERSEGARDRLAAIPGLRVAERLDDLPPIRDGVVVANELLDNLPFRRVRMLGDRPVELRVELRGGLLRSSEVPCDGELLALLPDGMSPGEESAIPTGALEFVDELARLLSRSGAILIDYGAATTGRGREVHGYRNQRVVGDVLTDPGEADITAGVDFGVLAARVEERGLRVDGIPSQRSALSALGFEEWIHGQLDLQGKLLRERAGIEAVRVWSGRSRATLLVDPGALGRLGWFMASTRDSPRPDWLPAATDDGLRS